MSGGHFAYAQAHIRDIADDTETLIDRIGSEDGWDYSPETIRHFRRGVELLREAYIYAQRIDWLVSGDDGEDTFHERLAADLAKLEEPK